MALSVCSDAGYHSDWSVQLDGSSLDRVSNNSASSLVGAEIVAVIGARERVLRDDFQPLHLQNPWTKGRLYVRLRTNLLAALEHGQVTNV